VGSEAAAQAWAAAVDVPVACPRPDRWPGSPRACGAFRPSGIGGLVAGRVRRADRCIRRASQKRAAGRPVQHHDRPTATFRRDTAPAAIRHPQGCAERAQVMRRGYIFTAKLPRPQRTADRSAEGGPLIRDRACRPVWSTSGQKRWSPPISALQGHPREAGAWGQFGGRAGSRKHRSGPKKRRITVVVDRTTEQVAADANGWLGWLTLQSS